MISRIWLKFYELMKRIQSLNLKDVGYYNCSLLGADGYCMVLWHIHLLMDARHPSVLQSGFSTHLFV